MHLKSEQQCYNHASVTMFIHTTTARSHIVCIYRWVFSIVRRRTTPVSSVNSQGFFSARRRRTRYCTASAASPSRSSVAARWPHCLPADEPWFAL